MDAATFPQRAGEILIRPVSTARSTNFSRSSILSLERNRAKMEGQHTGTPLSYHHSDPPSYTQEQQSEHGSRSPSLSSVIQTSCPEQDQEQQEPQELPGQQLVLPVDGLVPIQVTKSGSNESLLARRGSIDYNEHFAGRDDLKEFAPKRVGFAKIVMADVKTNVIVRDEYSFLTTLSTFICERYSCPESSVAVTLKHSSCLLLGGSFEPAYILTISTLPDAVAPTLNKRNAALIQRHMVDEIAVPFERGIIRFVAVADTCLAIDGNTLKGAVEAEKARQAGLMASVMKKKSGSTGRARLAAMGFESTLRSLRRPPTPLFPRTENRGSSMSAGGLFGWRKAEDKREPKASHSQLLSRGKHRELADSPANVQPDDQQGEPGPNTPIGQPSIFGGGAPGSSKQHAVRSPRSRTSLLNPFRKYQRGEDGHKKQQRAQSRGKGVPEEYEMEDRGTDP